ncbi:ATP-dependent DNA/RNA helicase DHX36-like [Haliotis asinina]|uniref:ATP-dependent DNA/RNA helicase DHX36-like n=1 Tax=Haliotis asinina TaxID=109174 RepID=UPI0035323A14
MIRRLLIAVDASKLSSLLSTADMYGRGRGHKGDSWGGRSGRGGRGYGGRRHDDDGDRHGRRDRGHSRHGGRDWRDDNVDGANDGDSHSAGGGRGGRPPPGLRGRDIGMWYARRSKEKKEKQDREQRPTVAMDSHREHHIRDLLDKINSSEPRVDMFDSPHIRPASQSNSLDNKNWTASSPQDMFDNPYGETSSRAQPELKGACAFPDTTDFRDDKDEEELEEEVPSMSAIIEYAKAEDEFPLAEGSVDFEGAKYAEDPMDEKDHLSDRMLEEYNEKQLQDDYCKMMQFRKKLPSYEMREKLMDDIRNNQVVVISGETGCGKTTQVPQFILDDCIEMGIGSQCRVICTQPRRISAISVAERVAAERCERCGGSDSSVGYQIRLEYRLPRKNGSILYCTTGIVLKFLESDPLLQRATHIVLDEIHERDLQSDFLMIILKDILPRRPDLKVILMSATLNAAMFSKYFNDCPQLNIPGYTYPVEEYLLEDVVEMLKYQPDSSQPQRRRPRGKRSREADEERWNFEVWCRNLEGSYSHSTITALQNMDFDKIDLDLIATLIRHISLNKSEGAILVFVPGWEEISKLHKMMQADRMYSSDKFRIIPLHSLMPTVNQREVFNKPPPGVRKVVIATNIAETSITIDDIVYVIDCGKIKVKDFQPENNLSTLEAKWVSKANSKQRRGRAGRVQPGVCYHLYTGLKWTEVDDYLPPEILRTRLEELCLHIKLLKLGKIEPFISKAIQQPSMEALHRAIITLQNLNALDKDENLLPLGYHLARMPVDPHTGKMILFGAMFCCLDPILTVAASLSFKDAFFIPLGKEEEADRARKALSEDSKSDHIMLIKAFEGWERAKSRGNDRDYCWQNFLSPSTLRLLKDMKGQLAQLLLELGFIKNKNPKDLAANVNSNNYGLVKAVLCAGLYPNVAKVAKCPRPGAPPYKMVSLYTRHEGKADVHPKSVNSRENFFESKWMVFYHKLKTTKVYVHDCTMVSPYPLLFFGGDIGSGKDGDQDTVSVDDWIVFKASPTTAQLVKDLRRELDKLLEHKITHPGPTSWNEAEKEGALMRAISDLITTDEDQFQSGVLAAHSTDSQHHRRNRHKRW